LWWSTLLLPFPLGWLATREYGSFTASFIKPLADYLESWFLLLFPPYEPLMLLSLLQRELKYADRVQVVKQEWHKERVKIALTESFKKYK
jgi:hypothetical protein